MIWLAISEEYTLHEFNSDFRIKEGANSSEEAFVVKMYMLTNSKIRRWPARWRMWRPGEGGHLAVRFV